MRVAILLMEDFPGSDNRVQRQCGSLIRAGHSVVVYCAQGPSTTSEWQRVRVERSCVRRVKAGSLTRRLFDYVAFPISCAFWLAWHGEDFDVVQVANPPEWLVYSAALWRRRRPGRRIVLDMHEPMPELMSAKTSDGIAVKVLRWLEKRSCRFADTTMVVTAAFRDRLASTSGVDAILVRNGVDASAFVPTPPCESTIRHTPLRVIYAGTVAYRFGVDIAIDAVLKLKDDGLDVVLDVYGDGDALPGLRARAAAEAWAGIRLMGQVPATVIAEEVRACAVGVVPYRDSAFMRLAESTKAFEYAISGIPIVCADLPSLRRQLGDDGAVFASPGDVVSFAAAVKEVLLNPEGAIMTAIAAQRTALSAQWSSTEDIYVTAVSVGSMCA